MFTKNRRFLVSVVALLSGASGAFYAQAQTPTVTEVRTGQTTPSPPRVAPKPAGDTGAKTPPLLWKTFLKRLDNAPAIDTATSSAAGGDKTAIYLGANDSLVCLDSGGRTQWATVIGATQAQPAFDDARVYVGTDRGAFYGISRDTGHVAWKYSAPTTILSTPVVLPNKQIVFECSDGTIYALQALSGALAWTFKRTDGSLGYASPVLDKAGLFVCGENTLYKLGLDGGKETWRAPVGGKSLATPFVAENRVFVGGDGSGLTAWDAQTGKPLWAFGGAPGTASGEWFGPPFADGGTVYVSTYNRYVYAVDAQTGRMKWSYRVLGSALTRPALDARTGVLYVTSTTFRDNPTVTALNARTGAKLWDYKAGYVAAAPVLSGNRLYVASTNGYLTVFGVR